MPVVDAFEQSVCDRTADEYRMEQSRNINIVDEPTAAAQQARIFEARDGAAHPGARCFTHPRSRRDGDGASLALHLSHDRAPLCEFLLQVLIRSLGSVAEHGFKTGFDELLLKGLVRPLLLSDVVELLEHRLWRTGGR